MIFQKMVPKSEVKNKSLTLLFTDTVNVHQNRL